MNPLTTTVCCKTAMMSKSAASKKRPTARVLEALVTKVDMMEFEFEFEFDEIPLIRANQEPPLCVS